MFRALSFVRRRGLDVLTAAVLGLAVYLLVQPSSALRTAWARQRADAATKRLAERLWEDLIAEGSALYDGAGRPQVVEVSDYECPYCRKVSASVDSAVLAGLRVALVHFPLQSHRFAEGAARAALCAERSGRFRAMHARLMYSAEWRSDTNWTREAQRAGVLDLPQFEGCLTSAEVQRRLAWQRVLVDSLRLTGTPTFVSRATFHRGVISMQQLRDLVPNR